MSETAASDSAFHTKVLSLCASVADLGEDCIDIAAITKSLQDSMNDLHGKYEAREEKYRSAAAMLKENYELIMGEAKKDAEAVVAAAVLQGEKILAVAKEESSAWTAEKERLAHVHSFKPQVKLDVGGMRFTTSLTTLQRFPDSMIGAMFSGRHALPLDDEGYFFIDRDGTHFRHILNFMRSPETFSSKGMTADVVRDLLVECEYYGLVDVMFEEPTDAGAAVQGGSVPAPVAQSAFSFNTGSVSAPQSSSLFGSAMPAPAPVAHPRAAVPSGFGFGTSAPQSSSLFGSAAGTAAPLPAPVPVSTPAPNPWAAAPAFGVATVAFSFGAAANSNR
jgi:hypothetical protein